MSLWLAVEIHHFTVNHILLDDQLFWKYIGSFDKFVRVTSLYITCILSFWKNFTQNITEKTFLTRQKTRSFLVIFFVIFWYGHIFSHALCVKCFCVVKVCKLLEFISQITDAQNQYRILWVHIIFVVIPKAGWNHFRFDNVDGTHVFYTFFMSHLYITKDDIFTRTIFDFRSDWIKWIIISLIAYVKMNEGEWYTKVISVVPSGTIFISHTMS